MASVLAKMELNNRLTNDFALSRFAAHAACALNTGEAYAVKSVKEMIEETFWFKLKKETPVAVQVVHRMLNEHVPHGSAS